MMKIGCCVNMLSSVPNGIGNEFLPLLPGLGYDYVELPLAQVMGLNADTFHALLTALRQAGIPCESCNNFFPASLRLTGPEADLHRTEYYLSHALERAVALGAQVIVFGSVGAKNIPTGFPYSDAWKQLVELLHLVSEKAAPYPLEIAIEPVNRRESNLILTLQEGLRLQAEAPHSNIRCLVDYYHMALEGETSQSIVAAGPLLCHTHFACPTGRRFPSPQDGQDYTQFFRALQKIHYMGRLSIEAFTHQFAEDSQIALPYLRTLAASSLSCE